MHTGKFSRTPKQTRSRESFDRVLDVATELLAKDGFHNFSIVAVSRQAKVSIGAIYGRVASKEDLVRSVQERVLDLVDREHDDYIVSLERQGLKLESLFRQIVLHQADFLRKHAGLLHSFISQANTDPVVRIRGKCSADHYTLAFCRLLLHCRTEITHPYPERAALTVRRMLWSSFVSFLGIENHEAVGEGNWNEIIEDVTEMGLLFLTAKERPLSAAAAKKLRRASPVAMNGTGKRTLAARKVRKKSRKSHSA